MGRFYWSICRQLQIIACLQYLSMFCLFYVSPIAISFIISVYVWVVVAKAKRDDRQRKLNWTVSKTSSLNETGGVRKSSSASTRRKRIRSILFVFSTTIWSALTLLPYRLSYILVTLNFVNINQAVYALLFMLLLNSVGNPFITMFTQRQYYRMAQKTVCIDCLHMRIDRFIVDYGGTLRETSNSSFSQGTLIDHRASRPMSSSERRRGNPERRLMRRSTDWILGVDDEQTSAQRPTHHSQQQYLSIPTPV